METEIGPFTNKAGEFVYRTAPGLHNNDRGQIKIAARSASPRTSSV